MMIHLLEVREGPFVRVTEHPTREQAERKLLEYCRMNWDDTGVKRMPDSPADMIIRFFKRARGQSYRIFTNEVTL